MKKIPYACQWIDRNDIKAVQEVLSAQFITQGPLVKKFENEIAAYCQAKYAVAVNSGTSALHIACLAAGLKKGNEGITSPITFVASSNALIYCGARPVFADVQDDTICIGPLEIKKKISKKSKVIIPVHFAGHPCEMEEIRSIAEKNNLIVIEDAAHALGAQYKKDKIGSCRYSDMTVLSFHAVKHITTGEGGMVLTNNKELYGKLKKLRTHGITRDCKTARKKISLWYYEMQDLGFNYRLTDIQCALGLSQLKKLPYFLNKRREIAYKYNRAFSRCEELRSLLQRDDVSSAYHIYVLRFNLNKMAVSRREIFDEYRRKGILVNVHYIPVYYHPYYKRLGYRKGLCKNAERYYEEAITLPLYPKMSDAEVKKVIKVTEGILSQFRKKK